MIVEPTVTDLLKLVDDRYELVIVTSKRARQLAVGAPKLTDAKEKSVVTIASKEIAEGKVKKVC
ncbi:MAG: DNA-directed RNA polymerase subunit omega [Clostridia bacterium]